MAKNEIHSHLIPKFLNNLEMLGQPIVHFPLILSYEYIAIYCTLQKKWQKIKF